MKMLTQEGRALLAAFALADQAHAPKSAAEGRTAWAVATVARLKSHLLGEHGVAVAMSLIPLGAKEAPDGQELPFLEALAALLGVPAEDLKPGAGVVSVEPDPMLPMCFCLALKPQALLAVLKKSVQEA